MASVISRSKLAAKLCSSACPHSTILCPLLEDHPQNRGERVAHLAATAVSHGHCSRWGLYGYLMENMRRIVIRKILRADLMRVSRPLPKFDQQRTKVSSLIMETCQRSWQRRAHGRPPGQIGGEVDTRLARPWSLISLEPHLISMAATAGSVVVY